MRSRYLSKHVTFNPISVIEAARSNGRSRRQKFLWGLTTIVLVFSSAFVVFSSVFDRAHHLSRNESNGTLSVRLLSSSTIDLAGADDMSVNGSKIWITISRESGLKNRYELEELSDSGSLVRVMTSKGDDLSQPGAVVASGGTVWVANTGDGGLTEFNSLTGGLIRQVSRRSGHLDYPTGLARIIHESSNEAPVLIF
jgi:hypothetical protein